MIKFKNKFLSQIPWWGYMMGPTLPNRQTYPVLPWVITPITPQDKNTRCGRGMICNVQANVVPGTAYLVTHNLGRVAQALIMISNQVNVFPPRIAFGPGARTNTYCYVVFDQAAVYPQFWVL